MILIWFGSNEARGPRYALVVSRLVTYDVGAYRNRSSASDALPRRYLSAGTPSIGAH